MIHFNKQFLHRKYLDHREFHPFLYSKCDKYLRQLILIIRYPFDWKTPFGYAVCVLIQLCSSYAMIEVYNVCLVLTTGMCMLIADFASDIKEKLRQFNKILISLEDGKLTAEDRAILTKKLNEIIEFYSEARQLSD